MAIRFVTGSLLIAFVGGEVLMAGEQAADLVLRRGKIVTLDESRPEAESLAISKDRILAVGSDSEIAPLVGETTRVISLAGRLVIPGFIEGHGHFLALGESRMILDLSDATSWEECVARVARAARDTPPGSWIVGRGWHQAKWSQSPQPQVEGYPTHASLSDLTPQNPVLLTHGTGHMVVANARAMKEAGVGEDAAPTAGGEALRDEHGKLTGVFRENAADPLHEAFGRSQSRRSADELRRDQLAAVRLAVEECLANGVTSFHDAGASFASVDLYAELCNRNELPVRLWVMLNEDNKSLAEHLADYRRIGAGQNHLTVRAIKRLVDGALGTHGAWLLSPYEDLPASVGHNTLDVASLRRTAQLALEHGFQMCVHAIGDRANREVLDLYEQTARGRDLGALRWRIEHAQHLDALDIPRFGALGVIASMQGVHCTSDAPFVVSRLGRERARTGAYAWRSLLDRGARVVNGTDVPVERISPLDCFYASVTRRRPNGAAFFPEQCLSRLEALRSYTREAAYAAFEEDLKGTLAPGKLADLVVLSQDILTIPEDDIPSTRVDHTIVGGRILYSAAPKKD